MRALLRLGKWPASERLAPPPSTPSFPHFPGNTGNGTARYWALKLLIDHTAVGDVLYNTTASSALPPGPLGGPPVFGQALVGASGARKLLLLNKDVVPRDVVVVGSAGATMLTVDFETAFGPPRNEVLAADAFTLDKFAVAVLLWP